MNRAEPRYLPVIEAATQARVHAYAPYSEFAVGAAIECQNGRIFAGVNVENASFGLAVCAERNAVAAAILAGLEVGAVLRVAVVVDASCHVAPCGACRQVLAEFSGAEVEVILFNVRDQSLKVLTIGELLPWSFDKDAMR